MRDAAIDLRDLNVRDIEGSPFIFATLRVYEDLVLDLKAELENVFLEFNWAAVMVAER